MKSRVYHTPPRANGLNVWLWCMWRGTEVFLARRGCRWSLPSQCTWPHSTCLYQGAPLRTHCLPPPGVNHTTGLQPWVLFCPWLSGSIDHKLQILYRLVVKDMCQQLWQQRNMHLIYKDMHLTSNIIVFIHMIKTMTVY